MSNVNRSSNENNNWQCNSSRADLSGSDPKVDSLAPPKPMRGNEAVAFKKPEGDAAVVDGDSDTEAAARAIIGKLGRGDSVEVKLAAELKMDEQFALDGTAKIVREDNGTVTVELEAEAKIGLGAKGADGKIGVGAGTKLNFATAGKAADFFDAFGKAGALTYVTTSADVIENGARSLGFNNSWTTAHERLAAHLGNVTEIKGEALAELTLKKSKNTYGFDAISAKAGVKAKTGFKIDLKNNTFSRTHSFAIDASADLKLPLLKANGSGKATVTVTETYKLTTAEVDALKGRSFDPNLLATNTSNRQPAQTTLKAEIEVGQKGSLVAAEDTKVKLTLEKKVDFTTQNFGEVMADLGKLEWKAEVDIGLGVVGGSEFTLEDTKEDTMSLDASVKYRHKEKLAGEYSLTEWIPRLKQQADDQRSMAGLRASSASW